jgi:hypothetical protein
MASQSNAAIVLKRGPLRTAEVWFQSDVCDRADIVHSYVKQPVGGSRYHAEPTIEIDLTADPAALLANMLPGTRNEIHHAQREGVRANIWLAPDDRTVRDLQLACNEFYRQKGMQTGSFSRLCALQRNRLLAISNAVDVNGRVLVWHSYVCASDHARQLHSVSMFRSFPCSAERNAIGRANRYLHYQDMLAFKSAGFRIYDFGGWYPGNDDPERLRINKFKEQFGGHVTAYFHCEQGMSFLGKCVLVLKRVLTVFE